MMRVLKDILNNFITLNKLFQMINPWYQTKII
jgi:hypothetical protein